MKLDPRLKEYSKKAENVDPGEAIDRLIEIYISACGSSLGERSAAACAANYWICRLKEDNPEIPRDLNFKGIMALRSKEYRENQVFVDTFYPVVLNPDHMAKIISLMLDDYTDETTRVALSMGAMFFLAFMLKDRMK